MIQGILARARALTRPPVLSAHHAPDPVAVRFGSSPLTAAGRGPTARPPPSVWDRDEHTGDRLPAGPTADPQASLQARIAHRHGWFASRAFEGAAGDPVARAAAVDAMDGWLRQDIPGVGFGWVHPSDLAVRLVHWHAGLAWLGSEAPTWLRDRLAGSAAWHLDQLRDREPADPFRAVVHHVGRVIGGSTFWGLPGAAAHRAEGLSGLGRDVARLMHPDGAPLDGAPLRLGQLLWLVALARAVTRANGGAFPAAADAAFARGARCLERLTGELDRLPALGDEPLADVLAAPHAPIAWSLWNLVLGWGLDQGDPAPGAAADPRLAWLGCTAAGAVEPVGKQWSMWAFREAGLAVAWSRVKGQASRVVAEMGSPAHAGPYTHRAPLNVLWDVGDTRVLADPGPAQRASRGAWLRSPTAHNVLLLDGHTLAERVPTELVVARVDGKKVKIEGRHQGWQRMSVPMIHERAVLINQARVIVRDRLVPTRARVGRHSVRLVWQLGPGWTLTGADGGYLGKNADLTMIIQLPATMAWSVCEGEEGGGGWVWDGERAVAAPCLVGDGGVDGGAEFTSSFELR